MNISVNYFKKKLTLSACILLAGVMSLYFLMLAVNRLADGSYLFYIPLSFPSSSLSSSSSSSSSSLPQMTSSKPRHQQLLLVTFGRSGSTFTSALISHHPDVFYTFEPLFIFQKRDNATHQLWENNHREKSVKIVNGFLSCDFTRLSGTDFDNSQLRNSGQETKELASCFQKKTPGFVHVGCFLQMLRTCQKKKVSLVKVIRLPVHWAVEMMETNPNLKLLYLIRDPRAVLFSQARVFNNFKWPTDAKQASELHCRLLSRDLDALEQLVDKFPARVKVIRYENGAANPVRYAQELYAFAGLPFDESTSKFVQSLTNSTEKEPGPVSYTIKRRNTTKTMNQWRYISGFNTVRVVDEVCGPPLYAKLGYKTVASQRDLESERPVYGAPSPGNIFKGFFSA